MDARQNNADTPGSPPARQLPGEEMFHALWLDTLERQYDAWLRLQATLVGNAGRVVKKTHDVARQYLEHSVLKFHLMPRILSWPPSRKPATEQKGPDRIPTTGTVGAS